jgi:acyl-CoA thioesterase-1
MLRLLVCGAALCLAAACDGRDTPDPAMRVDDVPAESTGASAESTGASAARENARVVLFLGTSLTAGYGLGAEFAFPARIQEKIDEGGLPFRVVNAGLSGETSAGGLRRIDWSLQEPVDVLVLELGANDGLRGLDHAALRANLDSIIARTRARYPDAAVLLLGMEAPPNMGRAYTEGFRRVYQDLAFTRNAALVPFLLEGVAGRPELNLDDRIHPNAVGQRILADNVWTVLGPLLAARSRRPAHETT